MSPPRSSFIEPCLPSSAYSPPSGSDWSLFLSFKLIYRLNCTEYASAYIPRMFYRSSPPVCLRCHEPMKVARTIPAVASLPAVIVFHCARCGEMEMREQDGAAA
jgi:hypothetical protein